MAERDEDAEGLKALRERTKAELRARLGPRCENVGAVEGKADLAGLEAFVQGEILRFGGRRVEVDDE